MPALLSISRAFRSLGLPELIAANLSCANASAASPKPSSSNRSPCSKPWAVSAREDMHLLAGDDCLERGLGYEPAQSHGGAGFSGTLP